MNPAFPLLLSLLVSCVFRFHHSVTEIEKQRCPQETSTVAAPVCATRWRHTIIIAAREAAESGPAASPAEALSLRSRHLKVEQPKCETDAWAPFRSPALTLKHRPMNPNHVLEQQQQLPCLCQKEMLSD